MLWIVIPAKNEAKRIQKTLDEYLNFFPDSQLVVAYVASADKTQTILDAYVLKFPYRFHYIHVTPVAGNSKGRALRDGFAQVCRQAAADDIVGFVDADNSLTPSEFAKLISHLNEAEVASASRYLPQSQLVDRDSILRVIASLLFRKLVKILFHLPVVDTQCGGKAFRARLLCSILPELHIDDMVIDVEVLQLFHTQKKKIIEVPVVWREDQASTISVSFWHFLSTSLQMVYSLFKLRFF
jgi:glycosyltransferase involved in cell wall biosynthesis